MEKENVQQKYMGSAMLRREKKKSKMIELLFVMSIIIYPLINFIVFYVIQNFNSILLVFQSYDSEYNRIWVGLANFKIFFEELFAPESSYLLSIGRSVLDFVIGIVISRPIGIIFAFFVYKKARLSGGLRYVSMLPSIISGVLVAMMFMKFVNAMPEFMAGLGIKDFPKLLQDKRTRYFMTIFYGFWSGFGSSIIYYSNAMNAINDELVESAQLDGITYGKELLYITIPMIFPTISTFIITSVTGLFAASGPLFMFWKFDAPADTLRFGYVMYRMTMEDGTISYPIVATMGMVLTLVTFPITLGVRWLMDRLDPNN